MMMKISSLPKEKQDLLRQICPGMTHTAEIHLIVAADSPDLKGQKHTVLVPNMPPPLMIVLAEYLLHLAAQKSKAGYEKALDLIREGAMTYKTREKWV